MIPTDTSTVDRDRRIEQQAAESRSVMLAVMAVAVLVFLLVAVLGQLQVGRWATAQVAVGLLVVEERGDVKSRPSIKRSSTGSGRWQRRRGCWVRRWRRPCCVRGWGR